MSFLRSLFSAKKSARTLDEATRVGDLEKVKALLKRRPDLVFSKNAHLGQTPLIAAARGGYEEIVKLLLANRSDVNARDNAEISALIWAASGGHKDVVELLLANGADVNVMDKFGDTALYVAARECHVEAAKLLLANGADINAKNKRGKTPLAAVLHDPDYWRTMPGSRRKVMEDLLRQRGGQT
jgi:ankyrin repeat protein